MRGGRDADGHVGMVEMFKSRSREDFGRNVAVCGEYAMLGKPMVSPYLPRPVDEVRHDVVRTVEAPPFLVVRADHACRQRAAHAPGWCQ